jgi:hypothetical protein
MIPVYKQSKNTISSPIGTAKPQTCQESQSSENIHDHISLSLRKLHLVGVVILLNLLERLARVECALKHKHNQLAVFLDIEQERTSLLLLQHMGEYPWALQVSGASLSFIFLPVILNAN